MLDFVMVIPTLNEQKYIGALVDTSNKLLRTMFKSYMIVVVDESSTDNTIKIMKSIMKENKSVNLIGNRTPASRGLDVRYAMSKYDSKLYFCIDADLEPTVKYLKDAVKAYNSGCEYVTGSRYINEKLVKRPPLRKLVSKSYNKLINIIFNDKVRDHQCGFKLFSKKAFKIAESASKERHWMWDTEVNLIMSYSDLKICEIPIEWTERRGNRTPIRRLLTDICTSIPGIFVLFYRFRIKKEYSYYAQPSISAQKIRKFS